MVPSTQEYLALFVQPRILKRGGGQSDISTFQSPIFYQKGAGLFSFLKGIGRRAIPFILKNVVPEAIDLGKAVLDDVASGNVKLKDSLKTRGVKALKGVARRTAGGGRIKKRRKIRRQKCYKKDVFG